MTMVLAADLGGTAIKAALLADDGSALAAAALPAPEAAADGMIAPRAWWDSFLEAARTLQRSDARAFAEIAAIAVTGVTRTPVVLDATGGPIAGAIPARDTRAQAIADRTASDVGGCAEAAHYDAFHPAARLTWLAEHEPAMADAAAVVDPKDFINARLTGTIAGDAISLARLIAAADATQGPSLLARLKLPEHLVPTLVAATRPIAAVRGGLPAPLDALAGRPVIMVSHDTWAGVVGLGALTVGRAYNVSGTTETLGVIAARPASAEGLIDLTWGDGLHQIGGPGQNGADALAWLGTLLGASDAQNAVRRVDEMLSQPRQAPPLLFLPFLSGERVPYWDADLRAAFLGLSRAHQPGDFAWAVLEGIALLNRVVLARAEAAAGFAVDEVRLGGGAARSRHWAQVKADVLERPVVTVESEEPGVIGAAIAAFVGLGRFGSLAEAQQRLVRVAHRYEPRREARDFYRALGLLFEAAHDAVRPLSHRLSRLRRPSP